MPIEDDQITRAVETVLKLVQKNNNNSKDLFAVDEDFFVQFSFKVLPKNPEVKNKRFLLPFPVLKEKTDICLFIPSDSFDLEVMKRIGTLPSQIKQVITIEELKKSYNSVEDRTRLASKYKLFLVEDRIHNVLAPILGRPFVKTKKTPLKIRINSNFSKNFSDSFKKARVFFGEGSVVSIKVGYVGLDEASVVANVKEAVKAMLRLYNVTLDTMHSVMVKTTHSCALPIYISPDSQQLVPDLAKLLDGEIEQTSASIMLNPIFGVSIKEQIQKFDPSLPFLVNPFGKKTYSKAKIVVAEIVKKHGKPFVCKSVETPDVPSLEFLSTHLLNAPNPTKLLKDLNADFMKYNKNIPPKPKAPKPKKKNLKKALAAEETVPLSAKGSKCAATNGKGDSKPQASSTKVSAPFKRTRASIAAKTSTTDTPSVPKKRGRPAAEVTVAASDGIPARVTRSRASKASVETSEAAPLSKKSKVATPAKVDPPVTRRVTRSKSTL